MSQTHTPDLAAIGQGALKHPESWPVREFSLETIKTLMASGETAYLQSPLHPTRLPFDGAAFARIWSLFQELRALCRHRGDAFLLDVIRAEMPERMDRLKEACDSDAVFLHALCVLNQLEFMLQEPLKLITLEYLVSIEKS